MNESASVIAMLDQPLVLEGDTTPACAANGDTTLSTGPKRTLHVLCIDDDAHILELMNDCLTHFEHQVSLASGGREGLKLFRDGTANNQPYDVVITDLGMPDMDGHQVARIIKAESPNTPVVMMTGWGSMAKDDGDTTPSVDIVVGKPPRIVELNDLLLRMATPAQSRL